MKNVLSRFERSLKSKYKYFTLSKLISMLTIIVYGFIFFVHIPTIIGLASLTVLAAANLIFSGLQLRDLVISQTGLVYDIVNFIGGFTILFVKQMLVAVFICAVLNTITKANTNLSTFGLEGWDLFVLGVVSLINFSFSFMYPFVAPFILWSVIKNDKEKDSQELRY